MTDNNTHQKYMNRCIELAKMGEGHTYPNPLVGSVIVYNGKIIGEGFHRKYGDPHAEVNAINSVKDKSVLSESTIYVNLEPCAHHGKTPPCADLIISTGIKKVVVATIDPFAEVAGKGIERMIEAGIDVTVGVLEDEARFLNRRFFTFHEKKRPYIIIKWAQTLDGFIDSERLDNNTPKWITNDASRTIVHSWRANEMGIMIGTNTAKMDNPNLNVREWAVNNPVRIVLDRTLRLSPELNVFDSSQNTIIYAGNNASSKKNIEQFEGKDKVEIVIVDYAKDVISEILDDLYNRGIQSIIVEGGTKLIESFYKNSQWDELRVFTGNTFFGKGVKAPEVIGELYYEQRIDECCLFTYLNR